MLFEIRHRTVFTYTAPVTIDPMTVRLRPRGDPSQRVISFDLRIDPVPTGTAGFLDLEGNGVYVLRFAGRHESLAIESRTTVEALRINPFDFIVSYPGFLTLPVRYPPDLKAQLAPYLTRLRPSAAVDDLAESLAREADGFTLPYLNRVNRYLHDRVRGIHRGEGGPWNPDRTLAEGKGACRDLAVLFIDLARAMGMACRFVSGYRQWSRDPSGLRELHAWAEVYVPGGGWRGYDPATSLAVGDHFVALAAAAEPEGASPTEGTYRGSGVRSTLSYEISLDAYEHGPRAPSLCAQGQL